MLRAIQTLWLVFGNFTFFCCRGATAIRCGIYARRTTVVDEGAKSADSSEVYTSIDFTKLQAGLVSSFPTLDPLPRRFKIYACLIQHPSLNLDVPLR